MLIKGFLHKINGEVMHPRSVVAKFGTTNEKELRLIDSNYEKIEMKKNHRYIYILSKVEKKKILYELKHKILPYPKDNNNCDWGVKK
jgi:hypothetical protein